MARPLVSFGFPVYNGGEAIRETIESILAQTEGDLELVISDNASHDDTAAIAKRYVERDPRVRYHRNQNNVGIRGNFNTVFHLSRAPHFRWIGVGDRVEPTYVERCVAKLEAEPGAVGVTTYVAFWDDDGKKHYVEYEGPRVESTEPYRRFIETLGLLMVDYRIFDPMYALFRRAALAKTALTRLMIYTDFALVSELSLHGPFAHVPECLAHRRRPLHAKPDWQSAIAPPGHPRLPYPPLHLLWHHFTMLRDANLPPEELASCMASALRFFSIMAHFRSIRPLRRELVTGLRRMGVPVDALKRAQGRI